ARRPASAPTPRPQKRLQPAPPREASAARPCTRRVGVARPGFGEAEARAAGRRFQEVAFEARGLGLGDVAARVAVDQFVFDGEEVFEEGVVGEVARLKLLLLGRGHLAQKVVDDSLSLVAWLCHGPSAFSAISLLLSVANDD